MQRDIMVGIAMAVALLASSVGSSALAERAPQLAAHAPPDRVALLVPALVMVLLGVSAVALGRSRWRSPLKLFGVGALLWAISVGVKFAISLPLSRPVINLLQRLLPQGPAEVIIWSYLGALTGLTEVMIFLVVARWLRRRPWSWSDAAALGVGFGAVEAILMGVLLVVGVAVSTPDELVKLVKLVDARAMWTRPLDRLLVLAVHVVCAVALIYAITRGKWSWFIFAFIYKSGVDAVGAYAVWPAVNLAFSRPWLVELALVGPFAYLAVPLLLLLKKRWDTVAPPQAAQVVGNLER